VPGYPIFQSNFNPRCLSTGSGLSAALLRPGFAAHFYGQK
jgi:hypothetical protein